MAYGMEYTFGKLGSVVSAVSPPNYLYIPSLPAVGAVWETQKVLMMFENYSAMAKTLVYYQRSFGHKAKA